MFYVPLLRVDCDDWLTKKKALLKLVKWDKLDIFRSELEQSDQKDFQVRTDYYKQNAEFNYKNNKKIQNIFSAEINLLMNSLKLTKSKITSSWFESSEKYTYHNVHNHGSNGYSAVCYIEYDQKEHTPTQFLSPFNNFVDGQLLYYEDIDVKEGTILFFPRSIAHYTKPNKSEKIRKIVSFNLEVSF